VFKETRKKRLFFFLLLWALASPAPKKTKNESSLEAAATAISHARRTVESQKRIAVGIGAISASLRGGRVLMRFFSLGVNGGSQKALETTDAAELAKFFDRPVRTVQVSRRRALVTEKKKRPQSGN
jgi:hypothetical protein